MKSFSRTGLFLSSLLAFTAASAHAEEGAATFWIDHDVLRYDSVSTKPDKGDTVKSDGLVTTPNDVTVAIFWNQYGLYVTPGNAGGKVQGSFYPSKEVELGLSLGISNQKVTDSPTGTAGVTNDTDSKTMLYGIFGTYYLVTSDKTQAEFTLAIDLGSEKQTSKSSVAGSAEVTNVDNKSTAITLGAQYAWKIAKQFSYVPGILYSTTAIKDGLTNGVDSTKNNLSLNIAHFRYIF